MTSTETDATQLSEAIKLVSEWLRQQALPFWSRAGLDGSNGFVERLSLDARSPDVESKRLRVQARQIYVFSHAYINGFTPGIDAAANGWRFVRRHAWIPPGKWARVLGRHGDILDPTTDLYDHAFALFGIAWWIRASGEDALDWAERTLEAIDTHLSTLDGVGWWSEDGPEAALLQNPHMHLLEGCLAAYVATDADVFRRYAERIVTLFNTRLLDPTSGTVTELFGDHWEPLPGDVGRIIEPGHQYEWAWLLGWASRWIPPAAQPAARLFEFSERFGCDPETGLVYDAVRDDGSNLTPTFRLWPNTEALKATLSRFELDGLLDRRRLQTILTNLHTYFLTPSLPGTWVDRLDRVRRPSVDAIPSSSMYHLHLAIAELDRLGPAVCADSNLAS